MKGTLIRKAAGIAISAAMLVSLTPLSGNGAVMAEEYGAPVFQSAFNGGGNYTDVYQHVEYTGDGGFVVAGYTFGDSESPEWTFEAGSPSGKHTNNDGVLVKYDKNHQIEWSMAYGGTGVEVFEDMDIMADGHIALAGRQSFTSGDNLIKGVSWNVIMVDPETHNIDTIYHIGGTSGDQAFGIKATEDGGFIVGGWSASKAGYVTKSTDGGETWSDTVQLWEPANGTNDQIANRLASGGSDSIVVRFDKDGVPEYCSVHNYEVTEDAYNITNPSERLESLVLDDEGNIVISGYGAVAKNVQNAVIAKLNGRDGSLMWHRSAGISDMKTVPDDAADYMKAVYSSAAALADGSYVAIGTADNDATTEEGWESSAEKDTIVVHYAQDGSVINAESFGRISDNNSRPEGVTAAEDGGYYLYGSTNGVLYEDDQIAKGYNWGNYGAQDAIIVKYDKNDRVEWAENYGSTGGDWINGLASGKDGSFIAVGESNGSFGIPSYGNNGGIDGIVLISDGSHDVPETDGIVADGAVKWKDGTYTGVGNGYGGNMTMQVMIEDGKITDVTCLEDGETDEYYCEAMMLFDIIEEQQTADVDVVTGATLSSNGMIEGSRKALSKAAAAYVDEQVERISGAENEEEAKELTGIAAEAYGELGTFAVASLEKEEMLKEFAEQYGISLVKKSNAVSIKEMMPALAGDLAHNDRYYKIQDVYYRNINADGLRSKGFTGDGITLAVIDSGLTGSHKDLDYQYISDGWDYGDGASYVDTETTPGNEMTVKDLYDNNGHGTAVTGIIQAIADNNSGVTGLLSKTEIVPLRVIPSTKTAGKEASSKQVAQAINDAVDKYHADVITTSLDVIDTEELKAAVAHAAENNIIVIGAAGNSSKADSIGEDAYVYPAAYDEVISVGAVDKNNNVRTNSQKNDSVFVTAPGENIAMLDISRGTKCKVSSGTSYSSPIVAAMAVAAKERMAGLSGDKTLLTIDQFKEILKATCKDAGEKGYDTSYGFGIVDLDAFAERLISFEEMADTVVESASQDIEDLKELLAAAQAEATAAQEAVDALTDASTDEEIAAAQDALTAAQQAVSELENSIAAKEELLNTVLKKAYPTIGEEVENLESQVEELNQKLSEAAIIDISNYSVLINGKYEYSATYTGKPIEPEVTLVGVNADCYSVEFSDNKKIGKATITIRPVSEQYKGELTREFRIVKASNQLKATGKTVTVKAKKLKKKAQTISGKKAISVSGKQGTLSYKLKSVNKAKAKKWFKVNAKTGNITIRKGLKKGTYKVKINVKASGNGSYKAATKSVTVKIKVK